MVVNRLFVLVFSMVVDYIRVRKSNIKELQEMIEERKNRKLMLTTLLIIPGLVLVVAIIGLLTTL